MEHEFCWYDYASGIWYHDVEHWGWCEFKECPEQGHKDHKHFGER